MNYNLTILFLLLSFGLFAQSATDLAQIEAEKDLATAILQENATTSVKHIHEEIRSASDSDDDGMEDAWEMQNGLDPNDPHDAWDDDDGDKVLNLFEFQLTTDPNDSSEPMTLDFGPTDLINDIYDAFDLADQQKILVRLSEGEYIMNYVKYFNVDFHLMIQGGWNSGFTIHDPDIYRTVFNGQETMELEIGTSGYCNYSALIFHGLEVTNSGDFSLGGGMRLRRHSTINKTSIYDCRFYENTYFGFSVTHRDLAEDTEFFMVNTTFANNPSGGIYTQVSDIAAARWRIYNTTIHNPGSSDGGIDGLTSGAGKLTIEFNNSINWGNDNYTFNFSSLHDVSIVVENATVDLLDPDVANYTEVNNLMVNPMFEDAPNNNFELMSNSLCIDAGVDVGLPYIGNAPDIGAEEYGMITNVLNTNDHDDFVLFPNIVQAQNAGFNLTGLAPSGDYTLMLLDVFGRMLWQHEFTSTGGTETFVPGFDLSKGTYFFILRNNEHQYSPREFVVVD